jgi:hypothetical protein
MNIGVGKNKIIIKIFMPFYMGMGLNKFRAKIW